MLFFAGCVDPFGLETGEETDLLVVDGSIIKGREKQVIKISRASSIMEPEYLPVENCNVKVIDK